MLGGTDVNPCAMEEEYREGMQANLAYVEQLRREIEESGASEEDRAAFQASLEQRFIVRLHMNRIVSLAITSTSRSRILFRVS